MYTIDGSKVLQTKTDAPVCKLENLNIPDGVYILKVSIRDNITETRRVIKY
ncbi:MAG: T9SS type A sorting domain-containing protein [Bacteroides nordii]